MTQIVRSKDQLMRNAIQGNDLKLLFIPKGKKL